MKQYRYLLISLFVLLLDFISKILLISKMKIGDEKEILPFFTVVHWQNRGGLWGFLSNSSHKVTTMVFLVIPIIGILFIFYLFFITRDKVELILLSAMIGGGIGNLSDRILNGAVTDFIYFHFPDNGWGWPAFNFADAFLSVSLFLYLLKVLFKREEKVAPDTL
jgi:signal peptidase II